MKNQNEYVNRFKEEYCKKLADTKAPYVDAVKMAYNDICRAMSNHKLTEKDIRYCSDMIRKFDGLSKYEEMIVSLKRKTGCDYGHAQKIVNMSFKYLFAIGKLDESIAKHCHMTIDSVTATFIKKENIDNNFKYDCMKNLTNTQYCNIQKKIAERCPKNSFPLLWEFEIWYRTKQSIAANALLKEIGKGPCLLSPELKDEIRRKIG